MRHFDSFDSKAFHNTEHISLAWFLSLVSIVWTWLFNLTPWLNPKFGGPVLTPIAQDRVFARSSIIWTQFDLILPWFCYRSIAFPFKIFYFLENAQKLYVWKVLSHLTTVRHGLTTCLFLSQLVLVKQAFDFCS